MDDDDWERRMAELWSAFDGIEDTPTAAAAFRARVDVLAAELPAGRPEAAFERACAFDSTGHPDRAVALYREALAGGLTGLRRRRATVQLASSLRNLGRSADSLALLSAELDAPPTNSTTPWRPSSRWPWPTSGASARPLHSPCARSPAPAPLPALPRQLRPAVGSAASLRPVASKCCDR